MITVKVSNGSKDRCRAKFPYKGIGKLINNACDMLDTLDVRTVISECIYDTDHHEFYNVLLYLIRENCDSDVTDELKEFNYFKL